ncbi:hypothetical protein GC176_03820 [bacterium]|nr:hypothetical protein [bacterium]
MKREHSLKRRLKSLETLSEAVTAMKSLSAHHFRSTRLGLPAARAYRTGVEAAIASLDFPATSADDHAQTQGLLLVGADLGLCDGYNSRLTQAVVAASSELSIERLYCIGHRSVPGLRNAGLSVSHQYATPTSTAGLTDVLLSVAEDVLTDYLDGRITRLTVISARFDGVGEFTPVSHDLLPISAPQQTGRFPPSAYNTRRHLIAVALREYLYIELYQTLLDSLASEHGARLVATESAGEWLDEKSGSTRRQLSAVHREAATQEVLDIAAACRRRNSGSSPEAK